MVENQLKLSNVVVTTKIEPNLPRVPGDANLLQQVFMNLIWNARTAMPKGGELRISAQFKPRQGAIEILVKDNGVGIPEKDLKNIFTPFFTTKEVGKGTGLGLWVVQSIIQEHNGTIKVNSRPRKGTLFTIGLPVRQSATGEASNS